MFKDVTTVGIISFLVACSPQEPDAQPTPSTEKDAECRAIWLQLTPEQRVAFGSEANFERKCVASTWVVQCQGGSIEGGAELHRLCRSDGGVDRTFKGEDG